jgi:hypothetical protein
MIYIASLNPLKMNKTDLVFIELLQKKIPDNISMIDEVASILGINYDAAYRRLNAKVPFSLKESVTLSKKFDISLNKLFEVGEQQSYLVRETKPINTVNDFTNYLKNLSEEFKSLIGKEDASILFSARELPMFYFFHQPILTKIKIFIWFTILKVTPLNKRIHFSDFILTDAMIAIAKEVGEAYQKINVTEMWSFGAINNVLQQLLYLHDMRQIDVNDVEIICKALVVELKQVENNTLNGNNKNGRKYELYSNDLIMMNNSMILDYKGKLRFGYPYALLKFFVIENQEACKEQKAFILEQTRHATCLTNTSAKTHAQFFNYKYDKIARVLAVINNKENRPTFL